MGFIHSPLLSNPPREWHGLCHAVDWYATFAALGGASVSGTGPLPADGTNIWPMLASNRTDPSRHMLIQYESANKNDQPLNQTLGVLRKGPWKLITGYPGWRSGWDLHVPLPSGPDEKIEGWEEAHTHVAADVVINTNCSDISGEGGASCCTRAPCLFNVVNDEVENHDVAEANPQIVSEMMQVR